MKTEAEPPLSPYRVLDLTQGECLLAGRMMGDLGADVIQVEPPGGSPSRRRGPFYRDTRDPEKSLFWLGFCLNKRSVTLDLESGQGRELFRRLVATAHFVLESFQPGTLDRLGLGYPALCRINPGIILVSITPFGQTGPKAAYKGAELIGWAASGMLYASGDPDRPPCVTATPLAGQQGAVAGVMGALTAHWHRRRTGEGQHVDVSIQEVMEWNAMCYPHFWPCHQMEVTRVGWGRPLRPGVYNPAGFPCKDGHVSITMGAAAPWILRATIRLHDWMHEEGMLPGWLQGHDWSSYDLGRFETQEELDRYQEPARRFLATRTKAELWRAAVERGTMTAPVRDFRDSFEDPHIRARGFWVDVDHPELGTTLPYPGPCFRLGASPPSLRRRAPSIGEHDREIRGELEEPPGDPGEAPASPRGAAPRTADRPGGTRGALDGIKVLDLGSMGVSPVTCKHLADHGATVVYLESHRAPDMMRFTPPYHEFHPDGSMMFGNYNTSKLSVSLDLGRRTGMEICRRLVRWADVLSCGRPASWMDRWGLGYTDVSRSNPRIIYCISSNVGASGPDAALFGHGGVTTALMGAQHLTGWPDRGPSHPTGFLGDTTNYVFGPVAILAALEHRERTGEGQLIDLSQVETYLWSQSPWLLDFAVNGRVAGRSGNRYPLLAENAPYGAFPCKERGGKDRWVAICVTNDDQWQAFCNVIGRPEWTREARFATGPGRLANAEALHQQVAEWTRSRSAEEVETRMQSAGVPAAVAASNRDLWEDTHLAERGYFRRLRHGELGVVPFSGPVFRLSRTPDVQSASPCLGEHNQHVCRNLLDMSQEEIDEALAQGGITTEKDLPRVASIG